MFFVVLCTIFLFFFLFVRAMSAFFCGCTNSHRGFLRRPLGKTLGIYPVGTRDIAWDLSGGRSGYRLGFIRLPVGKLLGIFPAAAQEIPKHIRYSLRCIRARSQAFSIRNSPRFGQKKQGDGATCEGSTPPNNSP